MKIRQESFLPLASSSNVYFLGLIMISVAVARDVDIAKVAQLYDMVGYGAGVSMNDVVLVAKVGHRLLGAVRLCKQEDIMVLRGMQIHPDFLRQGVGAILLSHCVPYLDQSHSYCLPYTHLSSFYARIGFNVAEPGELPPFLSQRLAGYVTSGRQVLAMRRLVPRS